MVTFCLSKTIETASRDFSIEMNTLRRGIRSRDRAISIFMQESSTGSSSRKRESSYGGLVQAFLAYQVVLEKLSEDGEQRLFDGNMYFLELILMRNKSTTSVLTIT